MQKINQWPIVEAGLKALAGIDYSIGSILKFTPPRGGGVVNGVPEIAEAIHLLCSTQAIAYGCLFDKSKKRSTESKNAYAYRLLRVDKVSSFLEGADLPNLRNKGIRNALAHFDERYLSTMINNPDHATMTWAGINRRGIFLPDPPELHMIEIGLYFFDEDELCLFKERLHLLPMRQEAEFVIEALGAKIVKSSRPDFKVDGHD